MSDTRVPIELVSNFSIAVAKGDEKRITRLAGLACRRIGSKAVSELILQSLLFCGLPRAINALSITQDILDKKYIEGNPSRSRIGVRGRKLCKRIYGKDFNRMILKMRKLHPDIENWILLDSYGRVLARPACPLLLREVSIVSILAVMGCYRQLKPHVTALKRMFDPKISREAFDKLCSTVLPFIHPRRRQTVMSILDPDAGADRSSMFRATRSDRPDPITKDIFGSQILPPVEPPSSVPKSGCSRPATRSIFHPPAAIPRDSTSRRRS